MVSVGVKRHSFSSDVGEWLGNLGAPLLSILFASFGMGSPEQYRNLGTQGTRVRLNRTPIKFHRVGQEIDPETLNFTRIGKLSSGEVRTLFLRHYDSVTHVQLVDPEGRIVHRLPIGRTMEEKDELRLKVQSLFDADSSLRFLGDFDNSGETNGFATLARTVRDKFGRVVEIEVLPAPFLISRAWALTVKDLRDKNPNRDISRKIEINSPQICHLGIVPLIRDSTNGELFIVAHIKPEKDIGGKNVLTTLGGNCFADALRSDKPFVTVVRSHCLTKVGFDPSNNLRAPDVRVAETELGNLNLSQFVLTDGDELRRQYQRHISEQWRDGPMPKEVQGLVYISVKKPPKVEFRPDGSGGSVATALIEISRPAQDPEGGYRLVTSLERVQLRPNTIGFIAALENDMKFVRYLLNYHS